MLRKMFAKVFVVLIFCFFCVSQVHAEDLNSQQDITDELSGESDLGISSLEGSGNFDSADSDSANIDNIDLKQDDVEQIQQSQAVFALAISDITVDNVNVSKGTFQVHVQNIQNRESVKKVEFAVWSEVNGQDDLIWYTANSDKNGEYMKEINISSHKYSIGRYQIHVYVTDRNGKAKFVGQISQQMDIQRGKVSIQKGKNEHTYTISVRDFAVPGGITEIQFPVWSETGGQDDVRWYHAEEASDGSWQAVISLKNHKGLGRYNVHAYAKSKTNSLYYVGEEKLLIEEPKLDSISVKNYDKKNGYFQIVIPEVQNVKLMKELRVAVWSEANGQDDIFWYRPVKNSRGEYIVDVSIKNHKFSMGNYFAHAYIRDMTGYFYFAGETKQNVKIEAGNLTAMQDTGNKRQYTIELKNVSIPGGAASIQFPVWSAVGGQDDIFWYTANKQGDGTYRIKMSIENHRGLGLYNVHAYAKMPNGTMNYIGETTFKTKIPKIGAVQVSGEKNMGGQFQVKITEIENIDMIQKIEVPIWSEQNQGDILWYTASKNKNGEYIVNANVSNHKYNSGIYYIHVYYIDATGNRQFAGKMTSCDMRSKYTSFTAKDTDKTERTYSVTLKGLQVPAGEKEVKFAVWGETFGQNDIHWYTGQKVSDGTYSYTVRIWDHQEAGRYNIHAYYTTKANALCYIGETFFNVSQTPKAVVKISKLDGTKGSFQVTAKGIIVPSGISKVQIPVWCLDNQSDLVWYDAIKTGEGVYTANVNVSNHAYHFGVYKADVYVTMGNGILAYAGNAATILKPKDYVYKTPIDSMHCEVGVLGTSASRVQFATWSNENGQDDLIWYEGVSRGDGMWNMIVDSMKHSSGGEYTTHVYVTDSTGSRFVGSVSYSLNRFPPAQVEMMNRAYWYSSSTPYLILVNRSSHLVGVFQGWQGNWNMIQFWDCADGKASTPTVEGEFQVGSRGHYFNSGAYRCYWWTQFYNDYLFHSVLYDWNGNLRDGRVGMGLSHGCVRLQIDNAKWIYDTIPSGTKVVVYH